MKIALTTIHYANSFGGMLQAFSTQKALSKYGDVLIINYRSPYLSKTMKVVRISRADFVPRDILRAGKDMFRLFPRYRLIRKFKSFASEYLNVTPPYNDISEMKDQDKKFDVFVTGSDQIWNPEVVGQLDPVYFLDFVTGKKKLSFASSSGSHVFSEAEKPVVIKSLDSFNAIAVRESDTALFLSELLGGRPVSHVLDPTLMLTKKEWLSELNLPPVVENSEKYILVYTLDKNNLVRDVVTKVSKQLGIKILAIDQDPFLGYSVDKHIMDASPRDFVALVSGASMIITNSFHGTTFAVNFSIPFVSVKPGTGLNRIGSFLQSIGLSDRLIKDVDDLDRAIESEINFADVHVKLRELRSLSYAYLENALQS